MLKTRAQMEAEESRALAPYAQKSAQSAGRKYREPQHPYRTEYQRDRARIIHSRAFRRLEYKTQVFLNGTGDHLRTRLTHTMEVASISRTIARALSLNEDLAEAIALAHDLGHAPFGHSGEKMLDELMRGHGGFEHNLQSLRIVELIERKYPKFAGLNLCHEVIEGLQKHFRFYETPGTEARHASPSLEAQIANLSDEITYYSHDLDDGIDADLIRPEQVAELSVWKESLEQVQAHFPRLKGRDLVSYVIRTIIDREVEDVVHTSARAIDRAGAQSVEEVRARPAALISYSRGLLKGNRQLRKFLYANLYYNPEVAGANQRACDMLREVFNAYIANPRLLGRTTARRVRADGLHRTVCDYISGMTDRYLIEEHARLFPGASVSAEALKTRSTLRPAKRR